MPFFLSAINFNQTIGVIVKQLEPGLFIAKNVQLLIFCFNT